MAVTIRSFIAVQLTDTIREQISVFQSGLKGLCADVKWVRPVSMHITLKFLGNITSDQIEKITHVMRDIAEPEEPFKVAIRGVGAFPNAKRPRVLWLGIHTEGEALENMAIGLNKALEYMNIEREKHSFKPHLTLGRVKSNKNIEAVIFKMYSNGFESESFRVHHIHLLQSRLKSSGAEYQILKSIQL
ncbi:RNA 2',3'-cyclic phosphodiesterase [bacterium]|nr:RNA 2',3'-cyclic phosphodiesterase [bacterium]